MLCRSKASAESARAELVEASGNPNVDLILADLSSQGSIRKFVEAFTHKYGALTGIANCAGIRVLNRQVTEDGIELMFGTEYLGHFLLTNLLADALIAGAPSRVVTISGEGHKAGVEGKTGASIDFDDLLGEKKFNVYKASKQVVLAKILFTYEFARRMAGTGVSATTICPGFTQTNLIKNYPLPVRLIGAIRIALAHPQTPEQGARHIVYPLTAPELEDVTGKYFVQSVETESSPESYDLDVARRLWEVSEALVGQKFACRIPQPG
jgi:NAD(P)-dependent dehydrogenase (short-subunit alcohol dehydrogenase family)